MTRTSPKAIDESTLEKRQLCKPYVLRQVAVERLN